MEDSKTFWENSWKHEREEELAGYLQSYYRANTAWIPLFKEHNIKTVCDAACGFGAYSLLLASHGFTVSGFDISPASVALTKKLLERYFVDVSSFSVMDITAIGFEAEAFDAVTAHAVLDHLTCADARLALQELLRITRPGGLILLSFDGLEPEDIAAPHDILEDGAFYYTEADRKGMIFHYYDKEALMEFLKETNVIDYRERENGERVVVLKK